jgi:uncharacterized protein (DUF1697 family)
VRYLAIFRGMNAGTRGKVPMAELRDCLEAAGVDNVSTYANSGNALFDANAADAQEVAKICRKAVEKCFGLTVPTIALSTKDFLSAIDHAPEWWGKGGEGWRHDAVFLVPPVRPEDFLAEVGSLADAEDRVKAHGCVVFWSVPKKAYGRSPVAKVLQSSEGVYADVTLRSSTTVRNLYERIAEA